jgi:hypothetical protein
MSGWYAGALLPGAAASREADEWRRLSQVSLYITPRALRRTVHFDAVKTTTIRIGLRIASRIYPPTL